MEEDFVIPAEQIEVGLLRGQGGMSDVHIGSYNRGDGSRPEQVAIKVFRLNQDQERIRRRLSREARVWRRTDHDHVLKFYGTTEVAGPQRQALVMPWLSSGRFSQFVTASKLTGIRKRKFTLNAVKQTAKGIAYLHEISIVHGDLKANNLLVDSSGNIKISDFGRAFIVDEEECSATIMGNARWIAPEVLQHDPDPSADVVPPPPYSKKSDIWSLGITILEMFDGFESLWARNTKNEAKLVIRILEGERPQYQHYGRTTSIPELWDILQDCWRTEPRDRVDANGLSASLNGLHDPGA